MTNTRITDPEIFERRYPVILRQFSIREGSGGKGLHKGGDGVIRDIEFLEPIQCSILSERRVHRPYGMAGGSPAQTGRNLWIKRLSKEDGDLPSNEDESPLKTRTISLGGKQTVKMGKGDRIVVCTPGGGGWGKEEAGTENKLKVGGAVGKGIVRGSWADRLAAQEGV